jgi:threonine/homoserine/homoserine lactone efflux protein
MIDFFTMGTVLGLSAGLAPGPLLALVISETIQHDIRAGVKVAIAPLITDLPIIILTVFILSKLAHFHYLLGIISLIGGLFILYLGYQGIRTRGVEMNLAERRSRSFTKGVLANALSPHPYLFWFTVGAPTMTRAMSQDIGAAVAFILSFYVSLVGSKIALAILIGRSRSLFSSSGYLYTVRSLGFVLCVLAFILLRDGLHLLKVI